MNNGKQRSLLLFAAKTTQHPTAIGKKGLQHVQQTLPPTQIWSHHYCQRPLSFLARVNSQHNKRFHTKYMRQNELYNKLLLLRRFQLNDFSIRLYQHTQKFKLNFMISVLTMWVKGLRWKGTSFSMLGTGTCLLANSSYFRSKTWVITTMPRQLVWP